MSLLPACTLCRRRTIQRRLSNRHKEMGKKMRREYSFNSYGHVLYAGERPGQVVDLALERERLCMGKHFGFYVLTVKRKDIMVDILSHLGDGQVRRGCSAKNILNRIKSNIEKGILVVQAGKAGKKLSDSPRRAGLRCQPPPSSLRASRGICGTGLSD